MLLGGFLWICLIFAVKDLFGIDHETGRKYGMVGSEFMFGAFVVIPVSMILAACCKAASEYCGARSATQNDSSQFESSAIITNQSMDAYNLVTNVGEQL